jgi:hypothetical protein
VLLDQTNMSDVTSRHCFRIRSVNEQRQDNEQVKV